MKPLQAQGFVASASRAAIPAAMSNVIARGVFTTVMTVLPSANPAEDCAEAQILHLMSAHKYLSAALKLALVNDTAGAQHLTYYAQVRAALSIFCGSGIFILQPPRGGSPRGAFYIDSAGSQHSMGKLSTHGAIETLWPFWAVSPSATSVIDAIELSAGLNLGVVRGCLPGGALLQQILKQLCFDIINLRTDHDARNVASYEPIQSMSFRTRLGRGVLLFLERLLLSMQSFGTGSKNIDIYIARYAIQKLARSQGTTVGAYASRISAATGFPLPQVQVVLGAGSQLASAVVSRAADPDTKLVNMISRAYLLVRFAEILTKINAPAASHPALESLLADWLHSQSLELQPTGANKDDYIRIFEEAIDSFRENVSALADANAVWGVGKSHFSICSTQSELSLAWI